jgi:V8-like Glu-specific endopeptidase
MSSSLGAVAPTLEKQYSTGVHDNRFNLHELKGDPRHEKLVCLARSVAAVMRDSELIELGGSRAILRYSTWRLKNDLACRSGDGNFGPASETLRFKDEPVAALGTAFLVGPRLIASAGHVFEGEDLSRLRIVFDYFMKDADQCNGSLSVYRIKEIKAFDQSDSWFFSNYPDWALVELTEDVVGRDPLPVERDPGKVFSGNEFYLIGHPSGLPTKVTLGGQIKNVGLLNKRFDHIVDAFAGNSGSPLFDVATDKIIGIHTATLQSLKKKGIKNRDYTKNSSGEMEVRRIAPGKTYKIRRYKEGNEIVWRCELAQKMTMLADLIDAFNQKADPKEIARLLARAKGKLTPGLRDMASIAQSSHQPAYIQSSGAASESTSNSLESVSPSLCTIV